MAAQSKLFKRLIWLVDTIYSAGHISRDEIDCRCSSARYNDMHENEYGEPNSPPTSAEEKAIDQLVYKLYDLNENEINLIEKS